MCITYYYWQTYYSKIKGEKQKDLSLSCKRRRCDYFGGVQLRWCAGQRSGSDEHFKLFLKMIECIQNKNRAKLWRVCRSGFGDMLCTALHLYEIHILLQKINSRRIIQHTQLVYLFNTHSHSAQKYVKSKGPIRSAAAVCSKRMRSHSPVFFFRKSSVRSHIFSSIGPYFDCYGGWWIDKGPHVQ